MPILITAAIAAIVFIPGGWLIGWFGAESGTMDSGAIAGEVQRVLTDDYGLAEVQDVTCPDEVRPEQGTTFQCTFSWDGTEQSVPVTVGSSDGQLLVGTPEV
ncbi:DUF4333 domain-containing protein [uncultured Agrococcus sp.]|uniref:DUF4333 domain-containing protein n=1 Tax=uncultured Agrococcus sp. TaxID=382258 RepID=UPI0025E27F75|nr:DUF4333 domain-containing protein [uncultured Agrococcus sp.]